MRFLLLILLFYCNGFLWGQHTPSISKFLLNDQTTSKGVSYYNTGVPSYIPTTVYDTWEYADMSTGNRYYYNDATSQWECYYFFGPDAPIEVGGMVPISYRSGTWIDTDDFKLFIWDGSQWSELAGGGGGSDILIYKMGNLIGTRPGINFVDGTDISLDVVDNPGLSRVDVTVNYTGTGGGLLTASNGLNVLGTDVRLGGPTTENSTTITGSGFQTFNILSHSGVTISPTANLYFGDGNNYIDMNFGVPGDDETFFGADKLWYQGYTLTAWEYTEMFPAKLEMDFGVSENKPDPNTLFSIFADSTGTTSDRYYLRLYFPDLVGDPDYFGNGLWELYEEYFLPDNPSTVAGDTSIIFVAGDGSGGTSSGFLLLNDILGGTLSSFRYGTAGDEVTVTDGDLIRVQDSPGLDVVLSGFDNTVSLDFSELSLVTDIGTKDFVIENSGTEERINKDDVMEWIVDYFGTVVLANNTSEITTTFTDGLDEILISYTGNRMESFNFGDGTLTTGVNNNGTIHVDGDVGIQTAIAGGTVFVSQCFGCNTSQKLTPDNGDFLLIQDGTDFQYKYITIGDIPGGTDLNGIYSGDGFMGAGTTQVYFDDGESITFRANNNTNFQILNTAGTPTNNDFFFQGYYDSQEVFITLGSPGQGIDFSMSNRASFKIVKDDAMFFHIIDDTYDFRILDTRTTTKGLEYSSDYSSDYSNRSLVDKEYVDNLSGGGPGTGNQFAIPYWNTTTTLGSTSFTYDGANTFNLPDGNFIDIDGITTNGGIQVGGFNIAKRTLSNTADMDIRATTTTQHIYFNDQGSDWLIFDFADRNLAINVGFAQETVHIGDGSFRIDALTTDNSVTDIVGINNLGKFYRYNISALPNLTTNLSNTDLTQTQTSRTYDVGNSSSGILTFTGWNRFLVTGGGSSGIIDIGGSPNANQTAFFRGGSAGTAQLEAGTDFVKVFGNDDLILFSIAGNTTGRIVSSGWEPPQFTTAGRPVSPDTGVLIYNTTTNLGEIYDGAEWLPTFGFIHHTTASRPVSPPSGYTIYNTTTNKVQTYDGSTWNDHW